MKKTNYQALVQKRFPPSFAEKEFGKNRFLVQVPRRGGSPQILGSGRTMAAAWKNAAKRVRLA